MGAKITLNGNLGDDPRCGVTQDRNGEPLHWISFSMRQPHWSKNDRGEFVDSSGFWINVSWFDRKAETAGRLLKKGAAVVVIGDLHVEIWVDKDTGEQKAGFKVNASEVAFDMRSLADVTYRQRSAERGPQPQPNLGSNHPATGGNAPADAQGAPSAQTADGGFEDIPGDFMEAPSAGESTPSAAPAGKAAKTGSKEGGKAHVSAEADDDHASAFPTDDDRPI
ncbi:single-stranded DNA-binding protein [Cardiobacterium hominis]|uniref:single-stranded DNA-binding protein n=1 Tax=Cardiobacterium hominis TaxID=2718 RepID=UPI0028EA606C|nr:single-stranded DNA-binding protein [Cardiobacterium hominis]